MSNPGELRCSVVIPTHGRAASLREVIEAVRLQSFRDFELIVVVDGEDEATRALSGSVETEFPLRWIFLAARQGAANARNLGVNAAQATYVAFLDDDTLPAPRWLERHMLAHVADSDWIRIVRGKTLHSFGQCDSVVERFLRAQREQVESNFGTRGADISIGECCVGVNCSLRRDALLAVGGFDAHLRELDEDMELGVRLFLRGARFIFEPAAVLEHRDTKALAEYHQRCWRAAAATSLYRVTSKQERTSQLGALTRLANGHRIMRSKERFAWRNPYRANQIAGRMRRIAERSGSQTAARLWRSFMWSAEYWDEVRRVGLDEQGLRQTIGWPVVTLAFHAVAALDREDNPSYCTSPASFARMMNWLAARGHECVAPGGVPAREHCFELTFDDGYADLYTELFPLVERWSLRPLVFVVAGQIGGWNGWDAARARRRKLLDVGQMREMQQAGVRFGSHTMSHPNLTTLTDTELRAEVRDSKARLEDVLGAQIDAFAYPYGCVDERVRAAVGEAGYARAYTTYPGTNWFGDPLLLHRAEIGERDAMRGFIHKVKHGASPAERLSKYVPQQAKRVLRMLL